MDHQEALRLQAVEKYVLGDLPAGVREQFEEHYFDCPECARDLNALVTFATASREILEEGRNSSEIPGQIGGAEQRTGGTEWFGWFRPVIAVPALAALVAIIVYQNAVMIPAIKNRATNQHRIQSIISSFRLQGTTRGETITKVVVAPHESFELNFDFTPSQPAQSYTGRLLDSADREVLAFALDREQSNKEVRLVIPGSQVHTGSYALVFTADKSSSDQGSKMVEVQRINFAIENQL
jgi:Putative zinc-finger